MKDRASSPGDGGGPGNKGSSQRGSKRKQDLSPRSDPAESHRSSGHHHQHSHHHSHPKVPRESEGGEDDRSPLTPDVSIREESQQYNSNTATSRSNASAAADHHSRSSTDYPDWPTGAGVDGDPAAAAAAVAAAAASYDDRNPSIQAALMGKGANPPIT